MSFNKLVKPEIMTWRKSNSDPEIIVTDHNRGALSIDTEEIAKQQRMVNGTLRKFIVAEKRTISMSWEMLPTAVGAVVGGESNGTYYGTSTLQILGGDGIRDFIRDVRSKSSCDADFYVRLYRGDDKRPDDATRVQADIDKILNRKDDIHVMVEDLSWDIQKRGATYEGIPYDFWNVSVTLVEV